MLSMLEILSKLTLSWHSYFLSHLDFLAENEKQAEAVYHFSLLSI